jgi:ribosome production factor 1
VRTRAPLARTPHTQTHRHHRYIFEEKAERKAAAAAAAASAAAGADGGGGGGAVQARMQELGPRFTLKLLSLQKGTFDSKFGEYEWVHKKEMDTSRRRFHL